MVSQRESDIIWTQRTTPPKHGEQFDLKEIKKALKTGARLKSL